MVLYKYIYVLHSSTLQPVDHVSVKPGFHRFLSTDTSAKKNNIIKEDIVEQPLEIPVTVDQLNQDISTTDGPKTTATEETLDISVPPKYNYKPGRECINCAGLVSKTQSQQLRKV